MKRTTAAWFTVGVAALIATACKSSTDAGDSQQTSSGTYYVRFKANGAQIDYSSDTWVNAAIAKTGPEYFFVGASTPAGSVGEGSMSVSVFDPSPITTTTYSGGLTPVGTTGAYTLPQLSYVTGSSTYTSSNDARITLTEITSTTVKGTFQGTVSTTGKPSISITNGEFFAKRTQ